MNLKYISLRCFYYFAEFNVFAFIPASFIAIVMLPSSFLFVSLIHIIPFFENFAIITTLLGAVTLVYFFVDLLFVAMLFSAPNIFYKILPFVINDLKTKNIKKFNRKLSFLLLCFRVIRNQSPEFSNKYLVTKWNYLAKNIVYFKEKSIAVDKNKLEKLAEEIRTFSLKDEYKKTDLRSLKIRNSLTYFIPSESLRNLSTRAVNYLWKEVFVPGVTDVFKNILGIIVLLLIIALLKIYGIDLIGLFEKVIIALKNIS